MKEKGEISGKGRKEKDESERNDERRKKVT
jgi:hypothetical protein